MKSEIDKLLNSLAKQPNFMVMHFAKDKKYVNQIQSWCKDGNLCNEYRVLTFSTEVEEELKVFEDEITKVKYLTSKRPRYSMQGKFYDYLFVFDLPQNLEDFLKKVYGSLKNGAPSFIFLESRDKNFAYRVESILIECNFVATTIMEIDNLLVVSARKMHGWGG